MSPLPLILATDALARTTAAALDSLLGGVEIGRHER